MASNRSRSLRFACKAAVLMTAFVAPMASAQSVSSPPATASSDSPRRLIVKYRSSGPHAVDGCAEALARAGRPTATVTRDGSASLDRVHARFGLSRTRALFASPPAREAGVGSRPGRARPTRAVAAEEDAVAALADRRTRLGGLTEAKVGQQPGATRARAGLIPFDPSRPDESHSDEQKLARAADLAPIYSVLVPRGNDPRRALAALAADPHVEWVQPDHALALDAEGPNDPYLGSSGSWGQPYADLWGAHRVGAPEVWPWATGEGIVVAVVDTGLDLAHPDIAANVFVHPGEDLDGDGLAEESDRNGLDDDANGFIDDLSGFDFANSVDADEDGFFDGPDDVSDADPTDDNGHGTHIAGTIAAVANNSLGIVGIAPHARILPVKGFPGSGSGSDSVLWRAVLYAAANGADVINNSWSCGSPCPTNPLAEEVLALVEAMGAVVVTSAGNATDDVLFYAPENGRRVVTVGSIGADDGISSFSNLGWLVDLVAPGGGPEEPFSIPLASRNILSLLASGANEDLQLFRVGDDYLRLSGTSMSSPHVAGAAALLRGLRPELEPADVRRLLRMTIEDLGESGHDPVYGSGLLDLPSLLATPLPALELALDAPAPGALHDPASGPLPIEGRAEGDDLAAFELSVARGIASRRFEPLDTSAESSDANTLAEWDVAAEPDGPRVLRLRARLGDGRLVDEHTLFGLERNRPVRLSNDALEESRPALSGRRVYWHRDEDEDSPQTHDLHGAFFPDPKLRGHVEQEPQASLLLERDGDQRGIVADGLDLAWSIREEGRPRIEYCRLRPGALRAASREPCVPRAPTDAPGSILRPWLAGGWLVWARFEEANRFIEGCRLGSGPTPACVARPMIAASAGTGWSLEAFDGEWLLVRRGSVLARCRLAEVDARGSSDAGCSPSPITMPSGFTSVSEPALDGDLLAFGRLGIESLPPARCDPDASESELPGCEAAIALVVQYFGCWLEGSPARCVPIEVSSKARIEQAQGLTVSGRRIAYSLGSDVERPAVRFCELVRETQRCLVQRVTGTVAATGFPALDGDRLVWEDARSGRGAISGLVLPRLDPLGGVARKQSAGERFTFVLFGDPGFAEQLETELEVLAGPSRSELGLSLESLGRAGRFVRIHGRWPADAVGAARWQLRAKTEKGLFSDRILDFEIQARRRDARPDHARRG